MKERFPNFTQAADELDELTFEGYFGESVKLLVQNRETLPDDKYFAKILDDWNSDSSQYGKPKVKYFMILFIDLFLSAIKENPQQAIDVLAKYWTGTEDNPELEGISGYSEAIRYHKDAMEQIRLIEKSGDSKLSDRKRAMSSLLTAYSKSVEYIGQLLVPCIQLAKIINGKDDNTTIRLMKHTLYEKIEIFNTESSGKYKELTNVINRNIRNADAHLAIRYIPNNNALELKIRRNGKMETIQIPVQKWIFEIYPQPGWFIQSFIYSGCLIVLGTLNKTLFREKFEQIFGDIVQD